MMAHSPFVGVRIPGLAPGSKAWGRPVVEMAKSSPCLLASLFDQFAGIRLVFQPFAG